MKDKPVVLLTGAARGIGRATALALAEKGYRLGLVDRNAEGLATLAELLPGSRTYASDVTDPAAMRDVVTQVEAEVGPIGVVVACAGVGDLTRLPDLELDGLRAMIEVNFLGMANTIAAALPGMVARKSGHLVGISSVAGYRGLPWMASYSASKAAVSTYLEALRPALKLRGVTITTVCPGFVRTAMTETTPFLKPPPMMEPEQAARQIARAVERRPRNHVFPLSTSLGMAVLRHMPDRVFDWMMDRAGPRALTSEF
jgi:short-subunit dehydrogenase